MKQETLLPELDAFFQTPRKTGLYNTCQDCKREVMVEKLILGRPFHCFQCNNEQQVS